MEEGLDIQDVPLPVRSKTERVMLKLASGTNYIELGGKKLWEDRNKQSVSIPLGRKYRMICRLEDGRAVPVKVLTHSQYNRKDSRKA
jgi:hypothetical protein